MVRAGLVTVALVGLVRLEMIFNPLGLRFEVFDNRPAFGALAREAAGRPVIFGLRYARAAKYAFYTGGEAYCQPNVFYRTHHWQFRDDDTRFAGREVLVECTSAPADTTLRVRSLDLADGSRFTYFVDPDFRPVRRVAVACEGLPRQVAPGDSLRLVLTVDNPYDWPVVVGRDTELAMLFKQGRSRVEEYPLDVRFEAAAGGRERVELTFRVPEELAGGSFVAGFALRRDGYAHWFNSRPQPLTVSAL